MQIRRATSLIFFRPRVDFLLSVPAVPALLLLASIDLSFLQLCRDIGLDRSQALFVLFILLSLPISSCLHLIFTSLHPARAWTLVAPVSKALREHVRKRRIYPRKMYDFGQLSCYQIQIKNRNNRVENTYSTPLTLRGIEKNNILTNISSKVRSQIHIESRILMNKWNIVFI